LPGISVYEKSLAKDKVKEQARFRIVTLQPVVAALRFLTYDRDHGARAPSCKDFAAAQQEIDRRCPAFVSPKGSTSKTWLEQTLWVEAPALETLKQTLLFSIMIDSATDGGQALLVDQAEKLLLSLLDWVKRAGDAKFIPDKDKKIISRAQAVQWWHEHIAAERAGAHTDSGAKLRRKMSTDVAAPDIAENALALRRHYAEEIRSPKYMEPSDASALAMDVRARLMALRLQRFSGENNESPGAFHQRCLEAAAGAATARVEGDGVTRALAFGCLYDIVDRCQLDFTGRPA